MKGKLCSCLWFVVATSAPNHAFLTNSESSKDEVVACDFPWCIVASSTDIATKGDYGNLTMRFPNSQDFFGALSAAFPDLECRSDMNDGGTRLVCRSTCR